MTVLVVGVLLLIAWLAVEYGHRRSHRIATHRYHLGKKARARARRL